VVNINSIYTSTVAYPRY